MGLDHQLPQSSGQTGLRSAVSPPSVTPADPPVSLPERQSGSCGAAPSLLLRHLQAEVRHDAARPHQRRREQQQHAVGQSDAGQ